MKKDIFIDVNIAIFFAKPKENEYIKLIVWLMQFSKNEIDTLFNHITLEKKEILYSILDDDNKHFLAVSQKLINEYNRSASGALSKTAIPNIVENLLRQKRLNKISNEEINQFKLEHKKYFNKMRCNQEDKEHIPVVLLSDRKYALTLDEKFTNDLLNFPGYKDKVRVEKRPDDLPYNE